MKRFMNMNRWRRMVFVFGVLTLWTIAIFTLVPSVAEGDVPKLINFQGILRDGSGNPVPDAVYVIRFRIYDDSTAGSNLWEEFDDVQTSNGLFNVRLGDTTDLPNGLFEGSVNRFVGVKVGGDPESAPRTRLISVPFAFHALRSDSAATATVALDLTCSGCVGTGDIDATQVQRRVTGTAPPNEYITAINQDGSVVTAPDQAGTPSGWTDDGTVVRLSTNADDVGIGTTSPGAKLQIDALSNVKKGLIIRGGSSGIVNLQEWQNFGGSAISVVDASGRFGLGTTSPSARLGVESAIPTEVGIRVRGAASQTTFLQAWEDNLGTTLAGVTATGIFTGSGSLLTNLNASNIATGNLGIARMPTGGNWSLSSDLNVNSGHLFLNQVNSSVGIGTTSPAKKLEVAGSIKGDTVFSNVLSSNSPLSLQAPAGTTRMHIDDLSGYAGLGTVAPSRNLHIFENVNDAVGLRIENPNAGGTAQERIDFGAGPAHISVFGASNAMSIVNNRTSGTMDFEVGGSQRLFIGNNGNIGIGTNGPNKKLEVAGSIKGDTIFSNILSSNSPLSLQAPAGTTRMHIDDVTGSVGIGTTSPSATLHIFRSAFPSLTFDDAGATDWGFTHDGSNLNMNAGGATKTRFLASGNVHFGITGGNVGIGTESPANKLDVEGGAVIGATYSGTNFAPANGLLVEGNVGIGTNAPASELHVKAASLHGNLRVESAGGTVLNLDANDLSSVAVGSSSAVPLNLVTSNAVRMTVEAAGDVGIGTTTPTTRLQVAGGQISTDAGTVSAPAYSFSGDLNTGIYRPTADVIGFATSGVEAMRINSVGLIGIGTSTINAALDVERSGGDVATFDRLLADGSVVAIRQDGVTEGNISVSGTTVSYNAFTGSHYGWTEETLERGELVSLTGANRNSHDNPKSEVIYGIKRSFVPNDPACLGSYLALSEPGQPYSSENPHLIMAVGNGDMWVVDEGQNIQPGDYLISSSTPGHAMKDDEEKYPIGHIVARAAEGVDWASVSEMVGGRKHKKISVLFGNFVRGDSRATETVKEQQQTIENLRSEVDGLKELVEKLLSSERKNVIQPASLEVGLEK